MDVVLDVMVAVLDVIHLVRAIAVDVMHRAVVVLAHVLVVQVAQVGVLDVLPVV